MAWEDRLRQAAYTSPSGIRTLLTYEDVSRSVEKKTAAFNFPDADGTLVQDTGHKGRRYPLRLFFNGADHDTDADAFELTLLERGPGVLEHPRYGRVDVVPFGEIGQRDDLKTRAGQTVIEVVFWATIGTAYPTSQTSGTDDALAALDEYTEAAAVALEDAVEIDTQVEEVTFRDQWESFVDSVAVNMQELADTQAAVSKEFTDIEESINNGIDVLVGDPLTLAFQTMAMIKAPSRAASLITDRLTAYGNLADSIISGSTGRISSTSTGTATVVTPTNDNRAANELASRELFLQSAVAGSCASTMNAALDPEAEGGYNTRAEAISAAETLLDQFDQAVEWSDANYAALNGEAVDTGGAYQSLQKAVALAAGALVALAFNLKQERTITLTRPRSIVDFVAEHYGSVDDHLDLFINTNDLTGSEILELPRGRKVVVYG